MNAIGIGRHGRRTAEQALATRERIVLAAAAAFAGLGFSQTSLAYIAAEAGVTRGAVYAHFDGKRALYNAVCDLIDWPLLQGTERAPDACEDDPLGMLRRTVRAWMEDIADHPLRCCVLDIVLHKTEWTEENASLLERLHRANQEATQRIQGLLEEAATLGGLVLPMSIPKASFTLQAALLGIVSACLRTATTADLPGSGDWLVTALLAPPPVHPAPPAP